MRTLYPINLGGANSPCKGCDRRHQLCHSSCEDYLAFKEKNDIRLKEKIAEYRIEHMNKNGRRKRYEN